MHNADRVFEAELARRSLSFSLDEEGLYQLSFNGIEITANLENVRRDFDRDQDKVAIIRFVDQIEKAGDVEISAWLDVEPLLRYSLQSADYEIDLAKVAHQKVSDTLILIYVYVNADESTINFVTHAQLESWDICIEQLQTVAQKNMAAIAAETACDVESIKGVPLGMLSTRSESFKASLLASPALKDIVEPELGWPVFAVAPCRDFVYLLPEANRDFLGQLGSVVVREFDESAYPLTCEVLRISDDGIKVIGTFAHQD